MTGQLQFNDKMGIVKFKKTSGGAEESFSERRISAMQFYDEDVARTRNFASFDVNDEETGRQAAILLEILMEFKSFALLSRVERVKIGVRERNYYTNKPMQPTLTPVKVGYEQFEKFYIANDEGTLTLILAVNEFEQDKFALAAKIKPYLNRQALKDKLAGDWSTFEGLVKFNKLDLRKKEDFIRAFEAYQVAIR
jgi:hypothetical protein